MYKTRVEGLRGGVPRKHWEPLWGRAFPRPRVAAPYRAFVRLGA